MSPSLHFEKDAANVGEFRVPALLRFGRQPTFRRSSITGSGGRSYDRLLQGGRKHLEMLDAARYCC